MKNLINNDISRCVNKTCPLRSTCKRALQNDLDRHNGSDGLYVSVAEFEYDGGCENYLKKD